MDRTEKLTAVYLAGLYLLSPVVILAFGVACYAFGW